MVFVEGPEKLLIVVACVGQVLLTGLQDVCRLPVNDRIHGRHAFVCCPIFSVGDHQVTKGGDERIGASLMIRTILFQRIFPFLLYGKHVLNEHLGQPTGCATRW